MLRITDESPVKNSPTHWISVMASMTGNAMTLTNSLTKNNCDTSFLVREIDKKEKTVATKVQKAKLEKYETENVKLLKNYGLMNPEAIKPRPFYDLRQMLEEPAQYYFKQIDDLDLIDVIVRVAIGKHREWIHNRDIEKF
mgnify:CR=1 FL=1